MSQKDWLKIQFQEAGKQDLDDKMIKKLADFKFDYPTNPHDLRHYINNLLGVSKFIFSGNSSICSSVLSWVDHLDSNERLYEEKFEGDNLFGIKVCPPSTDLTNYFYNPVRLHLTYLK